MVTTVNPQPTKKAKQTNLQQIKRKQATLQDPN